MQFPPCVPGLPTGESFYLAISLLNAVTNLAVQVSPFRHQLSSSVRKPPKWIRLLTWGVKNILKASPALQLKKETENLRKDKLKATSEAADTAKACVWQRELMPHHGYQKDSFSPNLPLISKVHIKLIICTVFVLLPNLAEMGQVQKLLGEGERRQTPCSP